MYSGVTHSTAFLKSYKMDAFLNFVSEPYSLILSIGLVTGLGCIPKKGQWYIFSVWLWRLFLTRMVIVQQAAKKIIAASKESSLKSKMIKGQHNFLSDILNTTSVIMFLVMAYSTSSSNAYTLVRFVRSPRKTFFIIFYRLSGDVRSSFCSVSMSSSHRGPIYVSVSRFFVSVLPCSCLRHK